MHAGIIAQTGVWSSLRSPWEPARALLRRGPDAQSPFDAVTRPPATPMLDSPRLATIAGRVVPVVEDARPTEVVDDPAQRRDLILLEQARDGSLDAFNGLVECYQDHLFALVARMVRTGTRPATPSRRPSSPRTATCARSAAAASARGSAGSRSTRRWTSSGSRSAVPPSRTRSWRTRLAAARGGRGRPRPHRDAERALAGPQRGTRIHHPRPAGGHRAVRRGGLRLRRDRRADRCVAGHGQVADPSRTPRAPRPARRLDRPVPRGGRLCRTCPTTRPTTTRCLIAAFAAGDVEGADLKRAQALVAACDDCAALHHDLRAIAAAMPTSRHPPAGATSGSRPAGGRAAALGLARAARPARRAEVRVRRPARRQPRRPRPRGHPRRRCGLHPHRGQRDSSAGRTRRRRGVGAAGRGGPVRPRVGGGRRRATPTWRRRPPRRWRRRRRAGRGWWRGRHRAGRQPGHALRRRRSRAGGEAGRLVRGARGRSHRRLEGPGALATGPVAGDSVVSAVLLLAGLALLALALVRRRMGRATG